ncbi:DNA phosphorothioation system sulfurtransferase DndC [[Clostridium] innocuum]|jgi:DNA sulfur modification protein DndC|nr:DNA phosphorothioation system sulfurtransferase DndC [Erysipelotrichaceae bacterium]MCR0385102.1 DNA phosphorothioation system sulfurtransferase DndC [[Clostridium] innocuum]MCR0415168.1 DNA phosphorothioation system sulfurtransferase DndC [[Clostridium] innocuum]MCR0533217.1 DNA phosphorothioation system sulfurtransferase DndC [[Clostridium] innocuum]MCR0540408.1 DNA phosphorothioation system sulfurtransferase DndC [[Clostridium] innocuum]
MAITKDLINGLIVTIQNLYLADDIPWMIGYSGGKDSTAAVQLVWMAIEQLPERDRKKTIHIMNTDTLVESPVVSKWVDKSLKSMKDESEKKGLPFVPTKLIPDYNDTFWVNLIGRGYPFPRMKYRWCTDRLKIQPVNNLIKNKIAEHGEIILVLGTRKQESSRRNRTMTNLEKKRVRELLSPNPTLANELVFSPMEDWTDDDVWSFLLQYKNPWNYSNMDLMTMYRGATADNECPLQIDKSAPTCGKSRFGCWVCTMVEKDKSMEAMILNDQEKEWMSILLEFRNEFGNEVGDRERRSFRRMRGNLQGNYGKLFHGPYKKEVREYWLERLLNIQKEIQENGPEEFSDLELIRIPELQAIRRIWVNDKHEFDDSLPKIYESVVGKEFEDPEWIHYENFEAEEWNILKEVCEEMFPDEELVFEMMYSLVDVENKSSGVNQRKGILDSVNSIIGKTCYKNEEDATQYYTDMMQRKKENGGKYNEKFLDYQPLESEFDEEEE